MPDRTLIISADDIGISRGNTDAILDTVDAGAVTSVSILANGPAFEYAMEEVKKRKGLLINVHLNLTEGKPLTLVPHLVNKKGDFRYGVGGLWLAYLSADTETKKELRKEIRAELAAQITRVREELGFAPVPVDGHQHVHMLPFVLTELLGIAREGAITRVRIPEEPLSVAKAFPSYSTLRHLIGGQIVLSYLAKLARPRVKALNLAMNDSFVGLLYSGAMTGKTAEAGLRAVVAVGKADGETELLFHPGEADRAEPFEWSGVCDWHFAPARGIERAYVKSEEGKKLFADFRNGTLTAGPDWGKFLRYIISGGTAAATNLIALFILTDLVGIWYLAANVLAFGISLGVSFLLQKFWTFGDRSTNRAHHQAFWYALVQVFGLAVDTLGLYIFVEHLHVWYLAAQFVLLLLVAVWNFFIFNFVIFKDHGASTK